MVKYAALFVFAFLLASCAKKDAAVPAAPYTKSCGQINEETDPLLLLAMQLEYEGIINGTDTSHQNEVLLHTQKYETIYRHLLAVKGMKHPATDTVFNLCGIGRYYDDTLMRRFGMRLKKSPCTEYVLKSYYVFEPCPLGDSMIFRYNVRAEKYKREYLPGSTTEYKYIVDFIACKPINTSALIKLVKTNPLVESAISIPSFTIKPLRISVDKTPAYTDYEFGYGWENCSPGCHKWRYWKFRVDINNNALFIGSHGDNSPPL